MPASKLVAYWVRKWPRVGAPATGLRTFCLCPLDLGSPGRVQKHRQIFTCSQDPPKSANLEPWELPKTVFARTVESLTFATSPTKNCIFKSPGATFGQVSALKILQNSTPNAGVQKCNPKTRKSHKHELQRSRRHPKSIKNYDSNNESRDA